MADARSATAPETKTHSTGSPFKRTSLVLATLGVVLAATFAIWQNSRHRGEPNRADAQESTFMPKITKTDAEWREQLTPEQYEVTRLKGTERAFTGAFWDHKAAGSYKCIGCGVDLFTSETKYDSGCGWPSFFASDHEENLHVEEDRAYGMVRTEVMCKNCGAHLGHLFDDGPHPSGQRYCMNSASLEFEKQDDRGKENGDP